MYQIYHTFLFQPILNLLIWLYNLIGDVGVAIIVVTVVVRFMLLPLSARAVKSQQLLQSLQPKMEEIKRKYKDDKEKQSKELMKFYQEHKVNPFSSCLPMLIQLPIIFALYKVFRVGLEQESMQYLYSFISAPEQVNPMFLGLVNMSTPNVVLSVLAGIFQFVQSKMIDKKPKKAKAGDIGSLLSKQMVYFMPAVTVFIAMSLPSGLALYWIATTVFAILQQYIIAKGKKIAPQKNK